MNAVSRLLSPPEAARMLGVSVFTVRRLVWRGDLPHVRIGRLVRLDIADLEAFVEASKQTASKV